MAEAERAVDPAAMDRLLDMTGGDPAFVDELVQIYLEDGVEQLAAMHAAANDGAIESLIRPAHSLKSNSANMGAEGLAQICRELESEARSGAVARVSERVDEAAALFERVRTELVALREPQ